MEIRGSKGFVSVMTAFLIFVFLGLAAFSIDLGYYFFTKKKLQNIADASATAAVADIENYDSIARDVIAHNRPRAGDVVEVERGTYDQGSNIFSADPNGEAVRVYIKRGIPAFFSRIFGREVLNPEGEAIARLFIKGIVTSVGATVLNIDTERSALLNGILGGLLGTTLSLDVVGWKGIADADLDLIKFLDLATAELNVGSIDELLNTNVNLIQLIDLMIEALEADESTAKIALNDLKMQIGALSGTVKLGDILKVDLNYGELAKADINLLSFLVTSAEVFNHAHAVVAGVGLDLPPLASLNLKLSVVEPPVIALAKEGTTIHSAAVRLFLDAKVLSIIGTGGSLLDVPIYLELGSADATVMKLISYTADINATASLTKVFIGGGIGDDWFSNEDETIDKDDITPVTILNASLLGIPLVTVTAKSYVNAEGGSGTLSFNLQNIMPITQSVYGTASIENLMQSLINNLELDVNVLGLGINVTQVLNILNPLLNTIGSVVGSLLDSLTTMLGISLGKTDVTVHSAAYSVRLVR